MKKPVKKNNSITLESPSTKSGNGGCFVEQIDGVRTGKIINIDETGRVFVDYAGNSQGKVASRYTRSVKLQMLRHAHSANQDVLLVFENSDPMRPVIIDTMSSLVDEIVQTDISDSLKSDISEVSIDGKKITFDAEEEVVIKCGKGSITLKKSGKIIIKGTNLISRSSGSNRIKGSSVNIN